MTLKQPPSQVVLVRRKIDAFVDDIANKIAMRRKLRSRKFITIFGERLSALDEILNELEHLQCSRQKEIPSDLRKKIIESEKFFNYADYRKDYKKLIDLL